VNLSVSLPQYQFASHRVTRGPEASTQLGADATVPANTAKAKHLRGKDAHQVDDVVFHRFRAEDESACHEDGADLLVPPIDDGFWAVIDNLEICRHCE
jgi:hypothetical protein